MKRDKVKEALNILDRGSGYLELNLDQFRNVYHKIINYKVLKDHTTFAVFVEDRIFITFPEKPDVRFVIKGNKEFFSEEDLDFISNLEKMGSYKGKYKFTTFIKEELKLNWVIFVIVFFSTLTLFIIANDIKLIHKINEMILTSITVFLSIFLLFVVSQRGYKDEFKLMKDGVLYIFFEKDRYMAKFAIFLVFFSVFNVAITYIVYQKFKLSILQYYLDFRFLTYVLTSFSLVILAICYLSIYQYYFERMKFLRLIPASKEILNDRIMKYKEFLKKEENN